MRLTSTLGALAVAIASVSAQDASDADVAQVRTQLANVVDATTQLDNYVLAFSGPADSANLEEASYAVTAALTAGMVAIEPIQGYITVTQAATQLLDQVNALNEIVEKTVQDLIDQKQLLVDSCLGPTTLAQLQQQLQSATAFRDTITSKFTADNQPLVEQVSQPSLDSLNRGITNFSDQTSLPSTCPTSSSSAAATSTSTPPSSSNPATSSATTTSSSVDPGTSSASASTVPSPSVATPTSSVSSAAISGGTTGAPPSRSASASMMPGTTITTTICHQDVCTRKVQPTKTTTVCHVCEASATTSPVKYTGAAAVSYAGSNVLALLAVAAAIAV